MVVNTISFHFTIYGPRYQVTLFQNIIKILLNGGANCFCYSIDSLGNDILFFRDEQSGRYKL